LPDYAPPLASRYPLLPSPYLEQPVPIPTPTKTAWLLISSSVPTSVHHGTSPPCGALWEGKWRQKLLSPEISSHTPKLSNLPASNPKTPVVNTQRKIYIYIYIYIYREREREREG
jgi:hypothetical protein